MDASNLGGLSGEKRGVDEIGGDFNSGVGERLDFDTLGLGSVSGRKRGVDEIGGDFNGGVGERLDFDTLGLGSVSGRKRGIDETGGDLDGGVCERLDDGGVCERLDDGGVRERLDCDSLSLGSVSGRKRGIDEIGGNLDSGVRERLDFDGGVRERLDFDSLSLGSVSGRKRGIDEIGGNLDGGVCKRFDFDGGVCERLNFDDGKRIVGVFDSIDGEFGAGKGVIEEGNEVANLFSSDWKLGGNGVGGLMELEKVGEGSCGLEGEKEMNFDLNVSVSNGVEFVGNSLGFGENAGVRYVIDKECMEVVNISSDESQDEEEELVVVGDYKGKGKLIENEANFGSNSGLDLDLKKINEVNQAGGGSLDCGSGYTREEKGKWKDVQPWMSLGGDSWDMDMFFDLDHLMDTVAESDVQLPEIFQQNEIGVGIGFQQNELDYSNWQPDVELEFRREQEARELELRREQNAREFELRREQLARIAEDLRQRELEDRKRAHRRFARPLEEDGHIGSSENEHTLRREKKLKLRDQPLIRWKPSGNHENNIAKRFVPSLLDLSLNVLANNADKIVSLEGVPYLLKQRLSNLLCDSRKMNVKVLDLFINDSPEEIRVKDTSWITEDQLKKSFGSFDPTNLKVFQLDLCGQCVSDDLIAETLAQSLSSFPGLGIISLRGACRLSDEALKVLVKLAPALCSINLGECSLLTHVGINYIADALGNNLRELYIDNCSRIDAQHITSALGKFKHLEVLSVAGILNLSDGVFSDIISACGRNIKDIDLADCERLTDSSLKIIGQTCSDLRALNIVNLHNLTDMGLFYLANGCKSIRNLILGRNEFSDEAIAEFIEIAGRSLEELSLNHVSQVGPFTALSLAKFSRKLSSLDLSWCRKVTDEALGLIVDSCWSLKLLKLFGCTQITNVFLDGHSNPLVKIIGLNMTTLLERVGLLKTEEVYLRYSPLPVPCRSGNLDHQDI